MKVGARSAEAILRILLGETVEYSDRIDDGAVYSCFDQSVCITEGKRKQTIMGAIVDLDNTLYSERQYIRSGYKAVSKVLGDEALVDRFWTSFKQIVYVGHNAEKDFQAPKQLGMRSAFFRNMDSLYCANGTNNIQEISMISKLNFLL